MIWEPRPRPYCVLSPWSLGSGTLLGDSLVQLIALIVTPYIVQAGSSDVTERSLKAIRRDFRGLGWLADGVEVQVLFSSIPSVPGSNTERTRKTHVINTCLRGQRPLQEFWLFWPWSGLLSTWPDGYGCTPPGWKGEKGFCPRSCLGSLTGLQTRFEVGRCW